MQETSKKKKKSECRDAKWKEKRVKQKSKNLKLELNLTKKESFPRSFPPPFVFIRKNSANFANKEKQEAMSAAEQTARDFYNTYHLAAMPPEVKRHLMILLLNSPFTKENPSYLEDSEEEYAGVLAEPEPFTMEDINQRLVRAEADVQAGRTMSCESVHELLEQKFPWLCE